MFNFAQKSLMAAAFCATGLGLTSLGPAALAQEAAAGRYTMHKTDDGFVRLDTLTGAVSLCRKDGDRWGCRTIAGEPDQAGPRRGDEDGRMTGGEGREIARLRRENSDLKEEIARLEELLGLRGGRGNGGPSAHNFKLPSEKDVDQAFDYFERMLRKFQDRLKRLEPEKEKAPPPERQL